ncbi:hypothetical protein KSP39_PZI010694 [Platanthera zijinensis]|uniref:Uncharacterized protein n=1 Tax=Platanthera zijinensis TaxID=2320716 RepID=A0AAP0G6I1_9ASPA
MASCTGLIARPCRPAHASLASSSSIFISCGGRALASPASLTLGFAGEGMSVRVDPLGWTAAAYLASAYRS